MKLEHMSHSVYPDLALIQIFIRICFIAGDEKSFCMIMPQLSYIIPED
jgi:hypothetical protein